MKIKYKYIITIILLIINESIFCQSSYNLISNYSFENGTNNKPDGQNQINNHCDDWKSLYFTLINNDVCTPDWYTSKSFQHAFDGHYDTDGLSNGTGEYLPKMQPHNGSFYAGLGTCEGMQIKLKQTIENNSIIYISLYYSPRSKKDTYINLYLMENKSTSSLNCNGDNINYVSKVNFFINSEGSDANVIPGNWYKYTSEPIFVKQNCDWFAIKGDNINISSENDGNFYSFKYVYIDDVEVNAFSYCDHQCYPLQEVTAPEIGTIPNICYINGGYVWIGNTYFYVNPWNITIKKTDKLDFYVFDRWGMPIYEKHIFDPNLIEHGWWNSNYLDYYQFIWNGCDYDNNPLPDGTYKVLIKLSNCYTEREYSKDVTVLSTSFCQIYPQYNPRNFNLNCCENDLTLTDCPLYNKIYIASNNINASTNFKISQGKSIVFEAGNQIRLKSGFAAYNGSYFRAKVGNIQCNNTKQLNILSNNPVTFDSLNNNNYYKKETLVLKDVINVFPNPNNGNFTIDLSPFKYADIRIFTSYSKLIYYKENCTGIIDIDLSQYSNGIYILNIESDYNSFNQKIIKQ